MVVGDRCGEVGRDGTGWDGVGRVRDETERNGANALFRLVLRSSPTCGTAGALGGSFHLHEGLPVRRFVSSILPVLLLLLGLTTQVAAQQGTPRRPGRIRTAVLDSTKPKPAVTQRGRRAAADTGDTTRPKPPTDGRPQLAQCLPEDEPCGGGGGEPTGVTVTPDGAWYQSQPGMSGLEAEFIVTNYHTTTKTFSLSCSATGSVTCGTVTPSSVTLTAGSSASPLVTYNTTGEGSGQLNLTAMGTSTDQGYIGVTVANPPVYLTLARGEESVRDPSLCVLDCFDFIWSHGTPAFYTLDQPRSLVLVYNSNTARPTPVIQLDVYPTGQNLSTYKVELRSAATSALLTQLNGTTATYFTAQSGQMTRVAGTLDAVTNGLMTGWHDIQATVTANYAAGSSMTTSITARVLVVNATGSALGAGVQIAGLQRLYFKAGSYGAMVVEGGAGAVYYGRTCTGCAYITPGGTSATLYDYGVTQADGRKFERRYLDRSVAAFTPDGRLLYVKDRFGNRTQYTWTDTLVTAITYPMNKVVTLAYVSVGGLTKLSTATDPAGRVTAYAIDASRRLTTITDPDLVTQSLSYAGVSQVVTAVTDRGGFTTDIAYTGLNQVSARQAPSVPLHDGTSARPTVTLLSEQAVVWQPTVTGASSVTAKGSVRPDTVWARMVDPMGRVTRYQLGRFGAAIKELTPGGLLTVTDRDSMGRATATTSPRGHRVEYLYAGYDLVRRRNVYTGAVDSMAYNTAHDLIWSRMGGTVRQYNYWSGANGTLGLYYVWQPERGVAEDGYHHQDAQGRDTLIRNAIYWDTAGAWNATRFTYETSWGNKTTWWDKHRGTSYRTIGVAGRPDTVLKFTGARTTVTYDVMNRVRFSRNALGKQTERQYDTRGGVVRVLDPKGQVSRFVYNAAGWMIANFDLADTLRADSSFYDLDGAVRRIRRRAGEIVTLSYDARGRTIASTATGAPSRAWRYDSLGAWVVSDNGVAYDSTVLDLSGRDTLTYQRAGTIAFSTHRQFDPLGRLVRRTMNAGAPSAFVNEVARYAFASSGMIDTLCALSVCVDMNPEPWVERDGYPDVGRSDYGYIFNPGTPTNWHLNRQFEGLGVTDELSREAVNWPNTPLPFAANVVQGGWGKSATGTLLVRNPGVLGPVGWPDYFRSDSLDRLIDACPAHAVGTPDLCDAPYLYAYDAAGNRTDGTGGTTVVAGNRYQTFNGVQHTYDLNGNVTALSGTWGGGGVVNRTLSWDGFGQLVKVKNSPTDSVLFGYDASGRRISKTTSAGTTYFVYEGRRVVQDVASNGQGLAAYAYYGPTDALFAVWTPQWTGVVLDDPINGTVRQVVEKDGYSVIKNYAYGNWGETAADTGFVFRFRFAGTEYDQETGLYHMGARYYLPQTGRFLSEDPAGINESPNLYVYSRNNPLSLRDPTGFGPECWADKFRPGEFFRTGMAFESEFQTFENQLYNLQAMTSESEDCRRKRENLKSMYENAKAQFEQVHLFGLNATATALEGGTIAVGVYWTGKGFGVYFRMGEAVGANLGWGSEGGLSDNMEAFTGWSEGACLGGFIVSGCRVSNEFGSTTTAGGSISPFDIGGHGEKSFTWASTPIGGGPMPRETPAMRCISASVGLAPYCR
jgi:RHS repeat-associated protein